MSLRCSRISFTWPCSVETECKCCRRCFSNAACKSRMFYPRCSCSRISLTWPRRAVTVRQCCRTPCLSNKACLWCFSLVFLRRIALPMFMFVVWIIHWLSCLILHAMCWFPRPGHSRSLTLILPTYILSEFYWLGCKWTPPILLCLIWKIRHPTFK